MSARKILDVVQNEGKAAVEFIEALGLGQRVLCPGFGEIARNVPPGDAQQVEIFPVERAVEWRARQHDRAL
jgi:hypothetical protein